MNSSPESQRIPRGKASAAPGPDPQSLRLSPGGLARPAAVAGGEGSRLDLPPVVNFSSKLLRLKQTCRPS